MPHHRHAATACDERSSSGPAQRAALTPAPGGPGADLFDFTGAFGRDVVVDFDGEDHIRLDEDQFANFAAVKAHAAQVGADVVVTLDGANSFTLHGVQLSNLKANDFLFV